MQGKLWFWVFIPGLLSISSSTLAGQVPVPTGAPGYLLASQGQTLCKPEVDFDIGTSGGTPLNLSDDGETDVTMPFEFDFYGVRSDKLRVGNNGGVIFNAEGTGNVLAVNEDFDNTTEFSRIYPFWDDLDSETGNVYYATSGTAPNRVFLIQWDNRPHFNGIANPDPVTFQLQLYETSNHIVFLYADIDFSNPDFDNGVSATVGLINETGTYTRTSFNSDLTTQLPTNDIGLHYECYEPGGGVILNTRIVIDPVPFDPAFPSDFPCPASDAPDEFVLDEGEYDIGICFEINNFTGTVLNMHDLIDTRLGTILSGFPLSLTHQGSVWLTQVERVTGTDGMTISYNSTWDAYDPAVKGTYFGQDMITVSFKDTNQLLRIIPSIIGAVKQKGKP